MTDADRRLTPNDLSPNDVALWLMRLDAAAPAALAQAEARLDDEERARAARFRVAGARAQFVAARALLRAMLSHHAGGAARRWRLRIDAQGRPGLDEAAPAFVFSLSHTEGLIACALARRGEIGVDVERVAPADDLLALARQSFSPQEAAHVAELAGAARAEAFFAYWTLKEAYVKARGFGLSLDTTAFAFDLAAPVAIRFPPGFGDAAARWRFLVAAPTLDARLALAAAAPLDLAGLTPRWVDLEACVEARCEP